jgi:hypothetical protein
MFAGDRHDRAGAGAGRTSHHATVNSSNFQSGFTATVTTSAGKIFLAARR